MHVRVMPKLHTRTECVLKFLPLYHISCMRGYYSTLLIKDVFQDIMCSKKANNNPGLHPVKDQ